MATSGKLLYLIRLRESANTHEPGLDLPQVVSVLSVRMNDYGFSPRSFLLVVWIMISHMPAYTRLAFYKTVINIFTNDAEPKAMLNSVTLTAGYYMYLLTYYEESDCFRRINRPISNEQQFFFVFFLIFY